MAEKNGFFPWKVQKLLSSVQEFAEEATKDLQQRKTPEKRVEKTAQTLTSSEPDLVAELHSKNAVIEVPIGVLNRQASSAAEEDWEILSEKASHRSSVGGGEVLVARAGSVRSIDHESSSHTTLSLPFKIQRTASSSTLDSQDNALGPSGKGVLGVDYVEHIVLSTDTLQGVCLAYKVSASHLRRANHFSGNSLHSAPKKLLIPLSKQALRTGFIRVQDTDTKEYKLGYFQAEFPDISATEAKAYLELADWELKDALQSAKEDREWEKEDAGLNEQLKSGQIGVKINYQGGKPLLNLKGIGHSLKLKATPEAVPDCEMNENDAKEKAATSPSKPKVVVHNAPPAIASKSVLAEDLFNAAPQHNSYGFELKPIRSRSSSPGGV
eukprot:Nitzschia sp. Nitz4//scaffold96_size78090//64844//66125//NITZ4_005504-RA/size78090-snap-gene-0.47-mRNA-1//1//CDS//3329560603//5435//frame0